MENLIKNLQELREKLLNTWNMLDIEDERSRAQGLKRQMNAPDFWQDREKAVKISKQAEDIEKEICKWEALRDEIRDIEELAAIAGQDADQGGDSVDQSLSDELHVKFAELKKRFAALEFYVLFSGKFDRSGAILSIHAGTGGVDAQDWAEMLLRMFLRYAEKKGWKTEILDQTMGNEAGVKSATIRVDGLWAYGHLRSENGVHRLVRISPFDAEGMRHTSFALAEVIPELPEAADIDIKDEDVRVDVYRSSGPGGQSVNTTDSAVRLVHIPTNITVTCQNERSQHQNRENAFKILKSKLFQLEEEKRRSTEQSLKGGVQKAEWGKQIRSYVLQPYQMIKDHRTEFETADVNAVLNGELDGFVEAYLRKEREGIK